jgi:hypothetical protein
VGYVNKYVKNVGIPVGLSVFGSDQKYLPNLYKL